MTVTTRIYYSTDDSAPVLSGTAGSLITLLDAVLVNGYGSRQAAGWTKPYSDAGTYKAVYRQGGGNQRYLRILDDAASLTALTGKAADARCYLTMSDVDTGTGQFPTGALSGYTTYCAKSSTADSTVRPWIIIATDRSFYIWIDTNSSSYRSLQFFGDIISINPSDTYNTYWGFADGNTGSPNGSQSALTVLDSGYTPAAAFGLIANSIDGTTGPAFVSKFGNYNYSKQAAALGSAGQIYPNPADNCLHMGRVFIQTTADGIRGRIPGLWNPYHLKPLVHRMIFSGNGALSNRQFIALDCEGGSGQCFIELSNTWY
jgi:hypothetical protein